MRRYIASNFSDYIPGESEKVYTFYKPQKVTIASILKIGLGFDGKNLKLVSYQLRY